MNSAERRILIVTGFGHMMAHYNMSVFPALVLPLTHIMGLSMPQVLELSFWHYLLFGVTALPWGLAGDRWGGNILMATMFVGAGLCALAAAFFIQSPSGLTLALAGVGLFAGIYHPTGMGLISKRVSRLNMAMGYNASAGGLGLVVGPLSTGIVTWLWGPTGAFITLATLNLFGVVLMALCPLGAPSEKVAEETKEDNGRISAFVILLIPMMLAGIVFTGATVILPAYLELKSGGLFGFLSGLASLGISGNLMATTVTSLVYMVGMLGQYCGGLAGDRYDGRWAYLIFHAVCIPLSLLMAYASNLPLIGLTTIYFFFLLGTQPPENTLVAKYTPKKLHHSAFGLKFVGTFGVGSIAVKLSGWIDSRWGVETVFIALSILSVVIIASVAALIAWTNRPVPEGRAYSAAAGQ